MLPCQWKVDRDRETQTDSKWELSILPLVASTGAETGYFVLPNLELSGAWLYSSNDLKIILFIILGKVALWLK